MCISMVCMYAWMCVKYVFRYGRVVYVCMYVYIVYMCVGILGDGNKFMYVDL